MKEEQSLPCAAPLEKVNAKDLFEELEATMTRRFSPDEYGEDSDLSVIYSIAEELRDEVIKQQEENARLIKRKDVLEEWLVDYRNDLKKTNVFHKNEAIINAITDLLDE